MQNSIIEISKKKSKAGRTPIKMILHKIHKDDTEWNKNGITWVRNYCENNIDSIKGMQLVAQFLDDKHEIPFGDHGNMIIEENKVIFEDSLVVGSFDSGEIVENIEVNGEIIDVVVGNGYVYEQRFPALVSYLQEQYDNANSVEGSVEISASKSLGNEKIIYDGGWKEKGRKPQIFEYSGHALVIGTNPADNNALLLEFNSYRNKEGEKENMSKIEINDMNYNDISILAENEFNKKFNDGKQNYVWFYTHKYYPTISTFIMKSWEKVGEYYKTTYSIEKGVLTIGDIIKVEEAWKPAGNDLSVEINTPIKNIVTKYKEVVSNMDEKVMLELNQKIEDKINEINSLNKTLEEKNTEINGLNEKVSELNSTLVEVNKTLEDMKTEKDSLSSEVNSLKEYKDTKEQEIKQAEVNTYFELEIPKNRFEEAEVNALKEYVEKTDLEGLKKAEAEMIVKRFKEGKLTGVEINSDNNNNVFFSTKEEKLDDIEAGKSLFV